MSSLIVKLFPVASRIIQLNKLSQPYFCILRRSFRTYTQALSSNMVLPVYPVARRDETVSEEFHGIQVSRGHIPCVRELRK